MIKIGDKAPDFSLHDTEKKQHHLRDYQGQDVVLLFFPLAFTGVCTAELCSVRDDIGSYNDLETQVLAISVDSLFTLGKFKEEQNYNFPLLSDWNKDVSRAYGTLYEEFVLGMRGVAKRSAFVIDKEGTIRYAEVLESAGDQPDFNTLKETLATIA